MLTSHAERESGGYERLEGKRLIHAALKISGCDASGSERIFRNRIAFCSTEKIFEFLPKTELQSLLPNGIASVGVSKKRRISNDQNQS